MLPMLSPANEDNETFPLLFGFSLVIQVDKLVLPKRNTMLLPIFAPLLIEFAPISFLQLRN